MDCSEIALGRGRGRVVVISDVHSDYAANEKWILDLPTYQTGDVLILAGDIGHRIPGESVTPRGWG